MGFDGLAAGARARGSTYSTRQPWLTGLETLDSADIRGQAGLVSPEVDPTASKFAKILREEGASIWFNY